MTLLGIFILALHGNVDNAVPVICIPFWEKLYIFILIYQYLCYKHTRLVFFVVVIVVIVV